MHLMDLLIGALALVAFLLFFGLVAFIWALRQLAIIGDQNDVIISLLQQLTVSNGNYPYIGGGLQENRGDTVPARAREMELHSQMETYHPAEPLFAKSR